MKSISNFDFSNQEIFRVNNAHSFPVTSIDFNSTATVVLSGSPDGSVAVINIPEPSESSRSSYWVYLVILLIVALFLIVLDDSPEL